MSSWIPSIPVPSLVLAGYRPRPKKPGPLPDFDRQGDARVDWQVATGRQGRLRLRARRPQGRDLRGESRRHDRQRRCRRPASRIGALPPNANSPRASAPVRTASSSAPTRPTSSPSTPAASRSGRARFRAKLPDRPPMREGIVVVWSLDGKIFGLAEADGSRKWVYQRTMPPLTVRRFAGGVTSRGGLFTGTAGGKLLAMDLATGALGWEAQRRDAQGRHRTRADRRRDQPARRRGTPGLCGGVSGSGRLFRGGSRQPHLVARLLQPLRHHDRQPLPVPDLG